jgi:DNA repair exonuclease SbcCD ATPase subunit
LDIEDQYVKYTTGVKWITDTTNAVATLTLNESRLAKKFSDTTHQIETLTRHIEEYRKAEDDILRNAQIDGVIKTMDGQKSILVQQSRQLQGELNQLIAQKAVAENRQNDLVQRIKDAKALEVAAKAYQAYLAAVCRDGLPYQLISQVLPQVEVEVNNILSQMVEFTVVFDVDGKNINGRIVYDDVRTWPLELASGMEKFVTGLAIRVALMSVSSLPKTNFLIVDEGISVCDSDSLGSLFMLFDMLKTQFDFILLISHLDIVRDISDTLIDIKRENGRSQVMF